jgi:exopolysaccharide biosynthesis protein
MKMIYRISALCIKQFRGSLEFASTRSLVPLLCVLCALCGSTLAQDYRAVHNGIEYATVTREFSGKPVKINLLRLDLKKVRLDVHHANDGAIGTETTSSIAKRHRAVAAINAGFFRLDTSQFVGDPVGLFMIDGDLMSEPANERIQLIINNRPSETDVLITRSVVSQSLRLGNKTLVITGVNRERKTDDLVMYTPRFGKTTLTGGEGIELVIVRGNIFSINLGVGNSAIPANGYVVSASGSMRDAIEPIARKAAAVALIRDWLNLPPGFLKDRAKLDVVTGVPQLIKNGRIDITWEQEKSSKAFVETRHPRTAVAKLKDGKFLMLTADGRSETSAGIDLYDLAAYLLELGAVDAMNLDGGGSTTMFLDGKVVNRPSDPTGERKVSDVLLVTPRGKTVRKMR